MINLNRPETVVILGLEYKIIYADNPSDVDIHRRESLWGQIDYWTRTIRIYDNNRSIEDIWHSLIHEVLHGIASELHIKSLEYKSVDDQSHHDLDILSLAITDVLFRNGWITADKVSDEKLLGKR